MSLQNIKSHISPEKKESVWNGKRILQKIANVRTFQKNKVSNSETSKEPRQGQNRFRALSAVTRTNNRTPRSKLSSAKTTSNGNNISMTDTKLNSNILHGIVKSKKEFEVNIPSSNAMCSDKEGIWIGCWNRTPISRLTCKDKIEPKENFDTNVSDMTVMPSGDILFTKYGDCAIKQYSRKDGSINTFRGCMPLFPEGIHATKSGDIFVTVVDEISFFVNKSTTRKVVKMNNEGKMTKDIEYGPRGLKLFILPYRVTENVNGDICVVNRTGRHLGQIVVLDSDGNFKFTYDGNPSLPSTDFIPMGIACDNNGCIIVSDPNDYSIHILDKTGCLIQHFISTNFGIGPPLSVCVDRSGVLWVGCGEESKRSNKSKVYALC